MAWKAGDEAIPPGGTQPIVLTSVDGTTATAVIRDGKRRQIRRYLLSELTRPGERVLLDAPAGAEVRGTAATPEDGVAGAEHVDFDAVFVDRARLRSSAGEDKGVVISLVAAGSLDVTSGRLTACDPGLRDLAAPFVRAVPCGTFPVRLARARGLNAAARVDFAEEHVRVDRWEPAVFDDDERPGSHVFGVDHGRACFADFDLFHERRASSHRVTFDSGAGDGGYACYFGLIGDRVAAAVIDFGELYSADTIEIAFAGVRGFASGSLTTPHLPGVALSFTNHALRTHVEIVGPEDVVMRMQRQPRMFAADGEPVGETRDGGSRHLHDEAGVTVETSFDILFEHAPATDSVLRLVVRSRSRPYVPDRRIA